MAMRAYRTIAIAYTDMSMDKFEQLKSDNNDFANESDFDAVEKDLTTIGIIGLADPLRDGIVKSITDLTISGVTTIMCTGDNVITAMAIARDAGILGPG